MNESLGYGGPIATACAAQPLPAVTITTEGGASHPDSKEYPRARLRVVRQAEAVAVARARTFGEAAHCSLIIGPWAGDPHCDQQATAAIAATVALKTGWPLLSYPVWDGLPDGNHVDGPPIEKYRVNIAKHLARMLQAIAAHASQYRALIQDSPQGFRLPENLLQILTRPFEVYIH